MAGKGFCWDVVGRTLEESWVPGFEVDTVECFGANSINFSIQVSPSGKWSNSIYCAGLIRIKLSKKYESTQTMLVSNAQ